ncbi:uncharacterized protein TrAtP1_009979 [Trichoderma atroviride]|uniref:uncharacterized protein n=1 Tax=Hypocrea atroviridis TaxID=63577 RepID=UPI00331AC566|nr:hypothetical protein TrAtP1_009979 [Trichoderma atroviride]
MEEIGNCFDSRYRENLQRTDDEALAFELTRIIIDPPSLFDMENMNAMLKLADCLRRLSAFGPVK